MAPTKSTRAKQQKSQPARVKKRQAGDVALNEKQMRQRAEHQA